MKTHELKSWPMYFGAMASGAKNFDLRRDDRGFRVGDRLLVREWTPADGVHSALGHYSGRQLLFEVTYILNGSENDRQFGLQEGFVALGVKAIGWSAVRQKRKAKQ